MARTDGLPSGPGGSECQANGECSYPDFKPCFPRRSDPGRCCYSELNGHCEAWYSRPLWQAKGADGTLTPWLHAYQPQLAAELSATGRDKLADWIEWARQGQEV